MEFLVTHQTDEHFDGDFAVAFIVEGLAHQNTDLQQLLEINQFDAKVGETLILNRVDGYKTKRVLAVGIGELPVTDKSYLKSLKAIYSALASAKAKNVVFPGIDIENRDESWVHLTTARVLQNAIYQIDKVNSDDSTEKNTLEAVSIYSENSDSSNVLKGVAIANGMALTRSLGDLPSNICTPSHLAETAKSLAQSYNLKYEILEESDMQSMGMNSLLSVSKGSNEPGKLISISYNSAGDEKPIVLVGKGVTFDSGGISLKPGAKMDEMKFDMCGAASVLGVMRAVAEMKLPVNLTVVVPTVENMPAHNASKPGDVVKSMSGQTIEILNTDAEGRLILCDALTYCEKFDPKVVIDIATLTGAVIIALGKHHSGLMANDQSLADDLKEAGSDAMDTVWQLPLDDEYDELLKSNFADMANIGGREAGTVTAACFLARFTKD